MGLNVNNKNTYRFVNDLNFIDSQFAKSNPEPVHARGDIIGLTTCAYVPYKYKPFVDMVKSCYVEKEDKKGKYLKAYRSPLHVEIDDDTMSRDHVLYTLILMKLAGENEFIKKMSKGLRWKISSKYSFTIESWLWMKGIAGNRFYMFLYYLIDIPVVFLYVLWNLAIFKIAGFKKESKQKDFVHFNDSQLSKRTKKYRNLLFPRYALFLKAFSLYVSPKSLGRWILKKVCLMEVGKENYVIRLFLDAKVNKDDVYSYKAMYGYRWWTYLSDFVGGYGTVIKNPVHYEENAIDVDIVRYLYEEKYKK